TEWQWVPVAVLVGSILLEGNSFRVAVKESSGLKGKQGWLRFLRTSKNPELPVLLLEDAGALVGLLLALIGVGMTLLTGNGLWDAFGTLAIGILLVFIAAFLAVEIKSLILGEAASPEDLAKIRAAIEDGDSERIIHIKTVHLGPEEILVAAKIRIHDADTGRAVADEIDAAEVRIREAVPAARIIYLEPDIFRA
ncbi:cation diffusion facilitator family transporter, partial [uncultured Rothia sp.]